MGFEIRNRAELVDALSVAAQVEHIVLVEYLYAAFSCRHTVDPSAPPAAAMTSWDIARELYLIAHEEMDHLGTVQQLLAALGAPPVPDAWAFPVHDPRVPFPCTLTRLDADAVDRFIQTETPAQPAPADVGAAPPDPLPRDHRRTAPPRRRRLRGRRADRPHGRTSRPLARGEIDVRAVPRHRNRRHVDLGASRSAAMSAAASHRSYSGPGQPRTAVRR